MNAPTSLPNPEFYRRFRVNHEVPQKNYRSDPNPNIGIAHDAHILPNPRDVIVRCRWNDEEIEKRQNSIMSDPMITRRFRPRVHFRSSMDGPVDPTGDVSATTICPARISIWSHYIFDAPRS